MKEQTSNEAVTANDGNTLLVAGLLAGDKVKYEMNYNGCKKAWDAMVIDTEPLTLRIKFPDGYAHTTEPDKDQWKFISQ